ncbi:D-2-hydroxyacid dehydrogenase [Roseococcus sp. YIM B11640]|uniref:D-2-hydroxyacid dehydrogenase n=1 Tax=Roseococcus sp. YIM B11640 TaxID=3133973 RepID=UPI003C7DC702
MSFPDKPTIGFAHVVYRNGDRFAERGNPYPSFEARSLEELEARVADAEVLVISGMWKNFLPEKAPKLKYVQALSSGTDQFDREVLKKHGITLCNAAGANAAAVSEHAVGLMLGMVRRLFVARDDQARKHWSGMKGDFEIREDELAGKTAIVVGMGKIGARLIKLLKAFEMTVIGVRANPASGKEGADEVYATADLPKILPRADFVVLVCPLTPETTNLIDAKAFALMKPSAYLVNCARGKVVDEEAMIEALKTKRIKGAGLDVMATEPLPESSPLWTLPNAFLAPHTGGETCAFENNVLDIMMENIERLKAGRTDLINKIV